MHWSYSELWGGHLRVMHNPLKNGGLCDGFLPCRPALEKELDT